MTKVIVASRSFAIAPNKFPLDMIPKPLTRFLVYQFIFPKFKYPVYLLFFRVVLPPAVCVHFLYLLLDIQMQSIVMSLP